MSTKIIALLTVVCGCWFADVATTLAGEASTATALAGLNSPDESVKLHAIDQLGTGGATAAAPVPTLANLLQDPSAEVRAHAASALRRRRSGGQTGRPRAGRPAEGSRARGTSTGHQGASWKFDPGRG